MEKFICIGIFVGCIVGIARYCFDDKWKMLPKNLCRFCASSWACVLLCFFATAYTYFVMVINSLPFILWILSTAVATVVASVSYVYIKNAD